jgi:hypothetical protein
MYTCMHDTFMYIFIWICLNVNIFVYITSGVLELLAPFTWEVIYIYIYMCMYIYEYIYIQITCMHDTFMYIFIWICLNVNIYVYFTSGVLELLAPFTWEVIVDNKYSTYLRIHYKPLISTLIYCFSVDHHKLITTLME